MRVHTSSSLYGEIRQGGRPQGINQPRPRLRKVLKNGWKWFVLGVSHDVAHAKPAAGVERECSLCGCVLVATLSQSSREVDYVLGLLRHVAVSKVDESAPNFALLESFQVKASHDAKVVAPASQSAVQVWVGARVNLGNLAGGEDNLLVHQISPSTADGGRGSNLKVPDVVACKAVPRREIRYAA